MATTRIMPLHAGKGRTVGKAISDIIDYVKNPDNHHHALTFVGWNQAVANELLQGGDVLCIE